MQLDHLQEIADQRRAAARRDLVAIVMRGAEPPELQAQQQQMRGDQRGAAKARYAQLGHDGAAGFGDAVEKVHWSGDVSVRRH